MEGVIKIYNKEKGFGFIEVAGESDIFFHYSNLIMEGYKTIEVGTEVEFEVVETSRGIQAHNILRI